MLRLLDKNASPVIVVVGMGGLGKTYLLQHVYNVIKERYEISIWLSVSQSYSISKLQSGIAYRLGLGGQIRDEGVDERTAAEMIYENLRGKTYLVVLDDVWEADEDLLYKLGLLTGNSTGHCKILITTRNREVCRILNAQIYEMQCLSDTEGWSLFCIYAFRDLKENKAPPQLDGLGHEILKQCGNLPLAIKMVAASLAKTTMPRDWESKLHQLKDVDIADDDQIMPILRWSYISLPPHLKACFAYLSFFPNCEQINCEYLVYLWIGEGFIPERERQWDRAWECLYQLANLCLIQLWELPDRIGLPKYCRTHDLLHDLAINISKENKCVFSVEEAPKDENGNWLRILLSQKDINGAAISERHLVWLRTLSLSQNGRITGIPANLFAATRGLRVLDLSGTSISALPEILGKLKLLKVLNLNDTKIEETPECVRHLKSLLFLTLPEGCQELAVWINELKCLQHLECRRVSRIPKGISKLISLRSLRSDWLDLSSEDDGFMRPEDFINMTQLEELLINCNNQRELERMKVGILTPLKKMRHLTIRNSSGNELELPKEIKVMKDLEGLIIWRFAVGSWICELPNLRELELNWCTGRDYLELRTIMLNLVRLELSGNYTCKELPQGYAQSQRFPQLRFFKIDWFYELEEFPELEEGAMASVEEFHLCNCGKLMKVGKGSEQLKKLKLFNCKGTDKLNEMFKKDGEYWSKIKTINPQVQIVGNFDP